MTKINFTRQEEITMLDWTPPDRTVNLSHLFWIVPWLAAMLKAQNLILMSFWIKIPSKFRILQWKKITLPKISQSHHIILKQTWRKRITKSKNSKQTNIQAIITLSFPSRIWRITRIISYQKCLLENNRRAQRMKQL